MGAYQRGGLNREGGFISNLKTPCHLKIIFVQTCEKSVMAIKVFLIGNTGE